MSERVLADYPSAPPAREIAPAAAPVKPTLSDERGAKRLRRRMRKLLARSPLRGVTIGIVVADVATGDEWFRLRPDKSLNPASNMKLFTSAAALDRMGPEHRFETELLVSGDTVYLRGTGDPLLTWEQLDKLVGRAMPGLRGGEFTRVAIDTSRFSGGVLPPGFGKKDTDASYRAATGAVALNLGTARVQVFPTREGRKPRVVITPPGDYVIVDNRARTVSGKGSTIRIRMSTRRNRSVVSITGKIGRKRKRPSVGNRRIEHPPIAAGHALRTLLRKRGVRVSKQAKIVLETAPSGLRPLAVHRSPPMSTIVLEMNKYSINFVAEMTLRAIGASSKVPGTWKRGRKVVERWLSERVGLTPGFRYRNGSGLYDGGRFSARQIVQLLLHMDRHEHRNSFRDSLAVAGKDGTLAQRLKGAHYARKVIGKTGTLNNVSALSGYARNRKGRLLAFSIIMNDTRKATPQMRRIQDRICALLVESR